MNRVDEHVEPGQKVEFTPAPKGLWWVILGAGITLLMPLFGFLVGTILVADETEVAPVYLGLFAGVLVGGVGVLMVIAGGVRLYRGWLRDHRDAATDAGAG